MKTLSIILLISLAALPLHHASAQKGLQTDSIFNIYGMQQESILVILSTDVLSKNSNITYYKSLVMKEEGNRDDICISAIDRDIMGGLKIVESRKNGKIETGYYVLKQETKSNTFEYILYKNKAKKLTLVYLKGNFPPHQLEQELDKLKDLFIYVNKKRIKLEN